MNKLLLSVVIPSYDEMANLQKGVLEKVARFLERKKYAYEVLVVDDGSTDGSVEFVEEFIKENPRFQLIKNPHMGKAGAVTQGMLKAQGEYILFTDMDQATPIEEVEKLFPHFSEGFDIVIGSRAYQRKGSPWTRRLMSKTWVLLRDTIVGTHGIVDTQCGFKMFKKDVAHTLFTAIAKLHHGFHKTYGASVTAGFDVEFLFLAQKMHYKIKEVPVHWLYVETRRVSPFKDSLDGIRDLFHIKLNALQGKYNVV